MQAIMFILYASKELEDASEFEAERYEKCDLMDIAIVCLYCVSWTVVV